MEYKVKQIKWSPDEVLQKMRNWCAYQERSQEEVRKKIRDFGIDTDEIENIIADLISENYLNEERFITAFCNGKLRIKNWGKYKIKLELRKHKVSEQMLQKALLEIDANEYLDVLKKVILKRSSKQKGSVKMIFFDTLKYCQSRGFEQDLVSEQLNVILKIKSID